MLYSLVKMGEFKSRIKVAEKVVIFLRDDVESDYFSLTANKLN